MGIRMANDRAPLKPGDMVMVSYPMNEKWNNPAHKYEGETFVIKSVKHYAHVAGNYRKMFTLYGAVSDKGMPYWFLPDELIPY